MSVIDGHPATPGWLGAVAGHRVRVLGVEHFGQTGTLQDLYAHCGLDTAAIVAAAASVGDVRDSPAVATVSLQPRPMRDARAARG